MDFVPQSACHDMRLLRLLSKRLRSHRSKVGIVVSSHREELARALPLNEYIRKSFRFLTKAAN